MIPQLVDQLAVTVDPLFALKATYIPLVGILVDILAAGQQSF